MFHSAKSHVGVGAVALALSIALGACNRGSEAERGATATAGEELRKTPERDRDTKGGITGTGAEQFFLAPNGVKTGADVCRAESRVFVVADPHTVAADDEQMVKVGECGDSRLNLYAPETVVDRDPTGGRQLYVKMGNGRYLKIKPR